MNTGYTTCTRWGIRMCLPLAACLWLGILTFSSARASGVMAPGAASASGAGSAAETSLKLAGWLTQPQQPRLYTHRADGLPRAGLLLIIVVTVQMLILVLRKLRQRR